MREAVFSAEEMALMLALVSKLDPDHYPAESAKSIIYKARATMNDRPTGVRIV